MKSLIDLWNPKNKFLLFVKRTLLVVGLIIFLSALIVPFIGCVEETKDIFKWLWIGLIVLNLDIFSEYKHAQKDKIITPITTVFIILLLVYLYHYWGLLSVAVVAISAILVGIWEFYITIALNKCIRITNKMKGITLNIVAIKNFALGVIYITSILLFILGHLIENNILFYVSGCFAVILLSLSILICISQLSLNQKSIIGIIFFMVDIVSLIGLLVYLIFSIEDTEHQTIISTITSALIGGVLTLSGVAWTIRQQEKIRRDDEKKKYRPIVVVTTNCDPSFKGIPLIKLPENAISYKKSEILSCETYLNSIKIRNTEFTPFYIYGILIDNKCVLTENKVYIDRNGAFVISCEQQFLYTKTEINKISLLTQDLLENFYEIPLKFERISSAQIEQPCFRLGAIIILNKKISQIICKDEMAAIELKDFSLKED